MKVLDSAGAATRPPRSRDRDIRSANRSGTFIDAPYMAPEQCALPSRHGRSATSSRWALVFIAGTGHHLFHADGTRILHSLSPRARAALSP